MTAISSIFWILGFYLSVIIAPQLRIWTWGPTMLCFAVSTIAALPLIWRSRSSKADTFIVIVAFALVFWISIRALVSPVEELAQADFLLTAMAVATFTCFRACACNTASQRILVYGILLLLAASVWVIGMQVVDREFSPVFPQSGPKAPAGFFAHYSYGASFLIPSSLIVASFAIHSREPWFLRIPLALTALAGMLAVYVTNSRGGLIGIGAGIAGLVLLTILVGRQRGAKWFAPAIIISPIILIGLAVFFLTWLGNLQENRSGSGDMAGLLDNTIRFYLIGIAVSCFSMHPFLGGGSRSYSWECFRFWDTQAMGRGAGKPEHVHNELLQTATDYGLVGVFLLVVLMVAVVITAVWRISSKHSKLPDSFANSWRIGGLAGFIGLFAQSNFEGIFRIPPGAILLALCLSAASFPILQIRSKSGSDWLSNSLIYFSSIPCLAFLALFGWKASLVSQKIWPVFFGAPRPGPETRADLLSEAIAVWPLGSLYTRRGMNHLVLASNSETESIAKDHLSLAVSDYQMAAKLSPFHPEPVVNSAILLGQLGRNQEAQLAFRRAVHLQGEMEPAFHANLKFAEHLHSIGLKHFASGDFLSALTDFQLASKHIEKAADIYGDRLGSEAGNELRVMIHEHTGRTFEELGEFSQALTQYDIATELRGGNSAHYRAAVLLGKRAAAAWSERKSSDALALFMKALSRMSSSRELPVGVDQQQKAQYVAYLRKTIDYLKKAKVKPSSNPDL